MVLTETAQHQSPNGFAMRCLDGRFEASYAPGHRALPGRAILVRGGCAGATGRMPVKPRSFASSLIRPALSVSNRASIAPSKPRVATELLPTSDFWSQWAKY